MNEIARSRLAELGRSKGRTLPHRKYRGSRRCEAEGCQQVFPSRRKTCPKCGHRHEPLPPVLCRLCDEPIPSNRRSWCGEVCLDAYFMVISGSHVRVKVFARDRGVCAECGLDTEALDKRIRCLDHAPKLAAVKMLAEQNFDTVWRDRWISLWAADHVEPLAEGGGYGLGNLQTLCVPCHKKKTAEQAWRKAQQRKLVGRKFLASRKRRIETVGARSAGAS